MRRDKRRRTWCMHLRFPPQLKSSFGLVVQSPPSAHFCFFPIPTAILPPILKLRIVLLQSDRFWHSTFNTSTRIRSLQVFGAFHELKKLVWFWREQCQNPAVREPMGRVRISWCALWGATIAKSQPAWNFIMITSPSGLKGFRDERVTKQFCAGRPQKPDDVYRKLNSTDSVAHKQKQKQKQELP